MIADRNLVEKSKSLIWSRLGEYNTGELRLLEVYLSRINARENSSSRVSFSLAEYAELLGVALRSEAIEAKTKNLMQQIVTFRLPNGGWIKRSIFPTAICEQDVVTGQYTITIDCHPDLKPIFFAIADDGYTKYRLKSTIHMKCKYSILLYSMLKDVRYKDAWEISVEDLREQLCIGSKYHQFREFNKFVLARAKEEINKYSDIEMDYAKVSVGRKVIAIRFVSHPKPSSATVKKREKVVPLHDGAWFAEATDGYLADDQAKVFAGVILSKIEEYYPNIPPEQRDDAAKETLRALYDEVVVKSEKSEYKSGAVMFNVIREGKAIERFIPGKFSYMMYLEEKKTPSRA